MLLGIILLAIVGVGIIVYTLQLYLSGNHTYWPKRGVAFVKPSEVGSLWDLLTGKKTVVEMDRDYYNKFKAKGVSFGGILELGKPVFQLMDLELVKQILVKDFDHFVDRRKVRLGPEPVLTNMLTLLEGQEWKDVRSVLSPTFTTGKIKQMFQHFNNSGKKLRSYVERSPKVKGGKGHNLLTQELVCRFIVDVIGATAFGMETNSLTDQESIFYKMAQRTNDITTVRIIKTLIVMNFPAISDWFKLSVADKVSLDFFTGILTKALRERQQADTNEQRSRNDFLQLLIEAKKGQLEIDDLEHLDTFEKEAMLLKSFNNKNKVQFTDELAVSQSVLFFVAGSETVGALLNFAVYLLAIHQDIQEKLYDEIEKYFNNNAGGEIEYEDVIKMEYLDMFISEILRKYPPVSKLERRCVKEYTMPGSKVKVNVGQLVSISVQGIHNDERYYPNPERFDPERFNGENKKDRHQYAYIPFGMGPRNCIGMRFALIESKVAIAYLVHHFLIQPTEKTPIPVKVDTKTGFNAPIKDLELNFKIRNKI